MAAVLVLNIILLVPKVILRVLALVELNAPVVKSNPFKFNIPFVNVVTPRVVNVNAEAKLVVILTPLIVNASNVAFPLDVIVPVSRILTVKLLNVPPLDNVRLVRFNDVAASVYTVVPKFNVLNQLPVVITGATVPEVKTKLGLLVIEPPVVPNVNVLAIAIASLLNPPVPV